MSPPYILPFKRLVYIPTREGFQHIEECRGRDAAYVHQVYPPSCHHLEVLSPRDGSAEAAVENDERSLELELQEAAAAVNTKTRHVNQVADPL